MHRERVEQLDFPISVAVCAWCEPCPPAGEIGAISHGICLRHLRFLKASSQGHIAPRRRRLSAAQKRQGEVQLPF